MSSLYIDVNQHVHLKIVTEKHDEKLQKAKHWYSNSSAPEYSKLCRSLHLREILYPALRRELEENQEQLHRFDVNGLLHLSCNIVVHHLSLAEQNKKQEPPASRSLFPIYRDRRMSMAPSHTMSKNVGIITYSID